MNMLQIIKMIWLWFQNKVAHIPNTFKDLQVLLRGSYKRRSLLKLRPIKFLCVFIVVIITLLKGTLSSVQKHQGRGRTDLSRIFGHIDLGPSTLIINKGTLGESGVCSLLCQWIIPHLLIQAHL